MKVRTPLLAALLVAASASPAGALEDVESPRILGMGGIARAAAVGAAGPLFNPAGMIIRRQYSIEAFYNFRVQDLGHTLHLSIVDSVTSRVAAGLYYSYVNSTPKLGYLGATEAKREGHESGLALAIALGERFGLGITTKYIGAATQADIPNPDAMLPMQPKTLKIDLDTTGGNLAKYFTWDIGFVLRLGDAFNIGVIGYNLVPVRSVEAPLGLGFGLSYLLGNQLLIGADVRIDFDRYKDTAVGADGTREFTNRTSARLGIGLEWLIKGVVAARGGFIYDSGHPASGNAGGRDTEFITLGLGYVGKQFGIDLGYRQRVGGGSESYLGLGLRVFLQ